MRKSEKPTALDLFCGCGGISAGLRAAGFEILAGVDNDPKTIATFARNFGQDRALEEDLSVLSPQSFMRRLKIAPGELDLLAGGPPCQGFSKNVPRKYRFADDTNNLLVLTFLRYAATLRPKAILMENVAEMRNGFSQTYSSEVTCQLEKAGYRVTSATLNAADYGVPQRRRRAFFVAVRKDAVFHFPRATHFKRIAEDGLPMLRDTVKRHVTVWDAIGDLPSVRHDETKDSFSYRCAAFTDYQKHARTGTKNVTNHKPRRLAETQHARLASLKPGEGLKELPKKLRPKSGYSGAYGRLTKDMIAPTITRWVFHPGSGRFGHPEDIRTITIREAARIQGFQDDFEFVGTYTQQASQVGNAVPPLLMQMIGAEIIEQGIKNHRLNLRRPKSAINSLMDKRSLASGIRNRIA